MSRKKKSDNLDDDAPGLDISSLIDVCFLLLIYFLVTTTIQPREQDLRMALPTTSSNSAPADLAPMFIKVNQSGQIFINSGPAEELVESDPNVHRLPELTNRLSSYVATARAGAQEPVVQVSVNGEAAQQRVVDVLNCLAGVKISSVTFTDLVDQL